MHHHSHGGFAGLMRSSLFAFVVVLVVLTSSIEVRPQGSGHVIHVDDDAAVGGNGTGRFPYNTLEDALAQARTTSADVVIKVAPGDYAIEEPLVIARSRIELHGSSVLVEDNEGWPTGALAPGTETRIVGTVKLGTQTAITPAHVTSHSSVNYGH